MPSASLRDISELAQLRNELNRFDERGRRAVEQATARARTVRDHIERRMQYWTRERDDAQRAVTRLAAELAACEQQPRANCSRIAAALGDARLRLQRCEHAVQQARAAARRADAAMAELHGALRRFVTLALMPLPQAASALGAIHTAVHTYTPTAHGHVATGANRSFALSSAGTADLPGIGSTGLVAAPLAAIDLSDSPITGPNSFVKVDYASMKQGLHKLEEVVLPAVLVGAGADHFRAMDAARGLSYEHGYQRVYDAFFADGQCIRLDCRPDGSFGVTNGYHRIHLGLELGWGTIPAKVNGSR